MATQTEANELKKNKRKQTNTKTRTEIKNVDKKTLVTNQVPNKPVVHSVTVYGCNRKQIGRDWTSEERVAQIQR